MKALFDLMHTLFAGDLPDQSRATEILLYLQSLSPHDLQTDLKPQIKKWLDHHKRMYLADNGRYAVVAVSERHVREILFGFRASGNYDVVECDPDARLSYVYPKHITNFPLEFMAKAEVKQIAPDRFKVSAPAQAWADIRECGLFLDITTRIV